MTIPASHCEAILRGMSKRADKEGDWIQMVWQIHPNDVPQALWNADLRSRWQLAFVEIDDQEQPVAPSEGHSKPPQATPSQRKPAATRAEKARRLCGVKAFQDWMRDRNGVQSWPPEWHSEPVRYAQVSFWIKQACNVTSKNVFDERIDAGLDWDRLLTEYEQATGRMAVKHG